MCTFSCEPNKITRVRSTHTTSTHNPYNHNQYGEPSHHGLLLLCMCLLQQRGKVLHYVLYSPPLAADVAAPMSAPVALAKAILSVPTPGAVDGAPAAVLSAPMAVVAAPAVADSVVYATVFISLLPL